MTIDTVRALAGTQADGSPDTVLFDPSAIRAGLHRALGADGGAVVTSQAIEFVKFAYERAGVDLAGVQTDFLVREGARMLTYAVIAALCAIAAAYNASRTAARIARNLRHDVYGRVLSFSPAEMGRFSEASLITRATNDIQQVQMVLVMCMRMVLFAPCMGVGAVVKVIGFGSTGLQWIILVGLAAIMVVIGVLMGLTMPRFRMHGRRCGREGHRVRQHGASVDHLGRSCRHHGGHRRSHGPHHAAFPQDARARGPQQPHRARDHHRRHADPGFWAE